MTTEKPKNTNLDVQNVQNIQLPRISFSGKIYLINSQQQLQAIGAQLENVKEFGFDTETRPSFKKGEVYKVSLLQLATLDAAYLFRLHRLNEFQFLKNIFENTEITKVGAALRDDLRQLQNIFKFSPKSFVELQDLAKVKGLKNFGLKGMTEEVLEATISKGPKLTNWEAAELTAPQQLYAATDAWIGLKLYKKLQSQKV